jgi:hypothetical protein
MEGQRRAHRASTDDLLQRGRPPPRLGQGRRAVAAEAPQRAPGAGRERGEPSGLDRGQAGLLEERQRRAGARERGRACRRDVRGRQLEASGCGEAGEVAGGHGAAAPLQVQRRERRGARAREAPDQGRRARRVPRRRRRCRGKAPPAQGSAAGAWLRAAGAEKRAAAGTGVERKTRSPVAAPSTAARSSLCARRSPLALTRAHPRSRRCAKMSCAAGPTEKMSSSVGAGRGAAGGGGGGAAGGATGGGGARAAPSRASLISDR